ncbi:MAG: hypothetical protein MJE68_12435 [Proteobacteria bacterium]|nr:hypothetical protein [Pseudomonadota bacterium]
MANKSLEIYSKRKGLVFEPGPPSSEGCDEKCFIHWPGSFKNRLQGRKEKCHIIKVGLELMTLHT